MGEDRNSTDQEPTYQPLRERSLPMQQRNKSRILSRRSEAPQDDDSDSATVPTPRTKPPPRRTMSTRSRPIVISDDEVQSAEDDNGDTFNLSQATAAVHLSLNDAVSEAQAQAQYTPPAIPSPAILLAAVSPEPVVAVHAVAVTSWSNIQSSSSDIFAPEVNPYKFLFSTPNSQ